MNDVPEQETSDALPVLPLKSSVLFPFQMMPLVVGRSASIAAVEAALATEDKTLLVIAHRLSTIQNADKVVVFDKGQVVEEGTYKQLVSKKGRFAHMVQQQQLA